MTLGRVCLFVRFVEGSVFAGAGFCWCFFVVVCGMLFVFFSFFFFFRA